MSLAWDPSPTLGVTYNLYRADTSGGPYAAVATGLAATVATDTSVTSGATYYYVVRAEGPGGESSASNEIQAVIP